MLDAELIERTRSGDVDAYATLYERHITSAQRTAYAMLRDHDDAQDVVSEAFMRALVKLRAGHGPADELAPYVNQIVRRLVIDRYRSSKREGQRVSSTALESCVSDVDEYERALDRDSLRHALNSLPTRYRSVLWQTTVEGRSVSSLADTLGGSPAMVASLAYRARRALQRAYLADGT